MHLATVDQQRELMRYMRGLNEWLARDVHDRQAEINSVLAQMNRLHGDLESLRRGMYIILRTAMLVQHFRSGMDERSDASTSPGATFHIPTQQPVQQPVPGQIYPPQQQGPVMPQPTPGFIPGTQQSSNIVLPLISRRSARDADANTAAALSTGHTE